MERSTKNHEETVFAGMLSGAVGKAQGSNTTPENGLCKIYPFVHSLFKTDETVRKCCVRVDFSFAVSGLSDADFSKRTRKLQTAEDAASRPQAIQNQQAPSAPEQVESTAIICSLPELRKALGPQHP